MAEPILRPARAPFAYELAIRVTHSSWFPWDFPGFSTEHLLSQKPSSLGQTGTLGHSGGWEKCHESCWFSHHLGLDWTFFFLVHATVKHRIVSTHPDFPISLFPFSFLMTQKTQASSSSPLNSTRDGGRLENYTEILYTIHYNIGGPIFPSWRKWASRKVKHSPKNQNHWAGSAPQITVCPSVSPLPSLSLGLKYRHFKSLDAQPPHSTDDSTEAREIGRFGQRHLAN